MGKRKIPVSSWNRIPVVQPMASHYTDSAIPVSVDVITFIAFYFLIRKFRSIKK
jgi:hypothetical protein